MDFQHRPGAKTGGGGVASYSETNQDRRERLRKLAEEVIDINKDPYFMKNHLGSYECKLCLTLHNNEGSYLTHTQGKKHQYNLQKRASEQAKDAPVAPMMDSSTSSKKIEPKKFHKIGRPGYKVTKQREPISADGISGGQQSMLFQIDYPEIKQDAATGGVVPRYRFMSAYEQHVEAPDRKWQYLIFAAEPYETIAFKIPSREIDKDPKKLWTFWNAEAKQFYLQVAFKQNAGDEVSGPPHPPPLSNSATSAVASSAAAIGVSNGGNVGAPIPGLPSHILLPPSAGSVMSVFPGADVAGAMNPAAGQIRLPPPPPPPPMMMPPGMHLN